MNKDQVKKLPAQKLAGLIACSKRLTNLISGLKVPVGSYDLQNITFNLSVEGVASQSEDTDKAGTSTLSPLSVLAVALRMSGVQRENIKALIIKAAHEAQEKDTKLKDEVKSDLKEYEKWIKEVHADVVSNLPRVPVKGAFLSKDIKLEVSQGS